MVIVRLMGGLGNQMFQYAAARRLALEQGVPLKLDVSWFAGSRERAYALGGLNVEAAFATTAELDGIIGSSSRGRRARALSTLKRHLLIGQGWTWIYEHRLSPYNRRVPRARGRVYLDGYWQSERYFADIAGLVRKELTYRPAPDATNAQWLARIRAANAVCVHVRRGDYLLPVHFEHHGVCSADYYRRAVRLIRERVANPQFFLFSDDWPWCR
ncbi:MAG TPA: alpha-1,2-fucosyltransferase, partial [Gemmatimonadales bacterium]|nr:alpha-1,2-fucosyltransferase [Gemmatimonadales bacterium]